MLPDYTCWPGNLAAGAKMDDSPAHVTALGGHIRALSLAWIQQEGWNKNPVA